MIEFENAAVVFSTHTLTNEVKSDHSELRFMYKSSLNVAVTQPKAIKTKRCHKLVDAFQEYIHRMINENDITHNHT